MERSYLYVFVRQDLSLQQKIIQAAHAVDEIASGGGNNIVLLGAEDEDELLRISAELSYFNVKHKTFFEPDISAYTALATVPLKGNDRRYLKRHKTM